MEGMSHNSKTLAICRSAHVAECRIVAGSLNRNLATDFHHLVVRQFEDI